MQFSTVSRLALGLLATTALASPALAQNQGSATIFKQVDENGVDVSSGAYELAIPLGSLGQGRLPLVEYLSGSTGYNLGLYFHRSESGSNVTLSVTRGGSREEFTGAKTATSFNSSQGTGAVLTKVDASQYLLTSSDGTKTLFTWPGGYNDYKGGQAAYCATGNEATCSLLAQTVTAPSLAKLTYGWRNSENCVSRTLPNGEIVEDCAQFYRIASITDRLATRSCRPIKTTPTRRLTVSRRPPGTSAMVRPFGTGLPKWDRPAWPTHPRPSPS